MDQSLSYGPLALFGSGEMDSSGRQVHEVLIKNFPAPVKIALVTVPAGFEANPGFWYGKLKLFLKRGLKNFQPQVELVSKKLPSEVDYVHAGAGAQNKTANYKACGVVARGRQAD